MKHRYSIEEYACRLRPVRRTDAQFIMDNCPMADGRGTPLQDGDPQVWLEQLLARPGDLHFIVEDRLSGEQQGLMALTGIKGEQAGWAHWAAPAGAPDAAEGMLLLCRIAFEQAGLQELYGNLPADGRTGTPLYTAAGGENTACAPGPADGQTEYRIGKQDFYTRIAPQLEQRAGTVFRRRLQQAMGGFTFHHLGVATASLEKELPGYTLLGYSREGDVFTDPIQGIRGLFITGEGTPRLELLENLPGSTTLDVPLKKGQKIYHMAYYVPDMEKAISVLTHCRAKILSPPKTSVYFGGRICFMALPGVGVVELLEETR